ncbi:MAG: anti-anti-sigma factor [Gammaproteobacteria bacterium]|nr:MAG: anti-anti-sigma factor [Gammaproteobacteria bacterium]
MTQAGIQQQDSHTALVSGVIDVTTATGLKSEGEALLKKLENTVVIDLSGIEHSDSVGVSVLLVWMRAAARLDKNIQFRDMPPKMFDVARVSGLDAVFPLIYSSAVRS